MTNDRRSTSELADTEHWLRSQVDHPAGRDYQPRHAAQPRSASMSDVLLLLSPIIVLLVALIAVQAVRTFGLLSLAWILAAGVVVYLVRRSTGGRSE